MAGTLEEMERYRDGTVAQNIDNYLIELIDEKIIRADKMSVRYGDLWRALEKLVKAGGKRLRPAMVYEAYVAYGGEHDDKAPLLAGCAIELLHISLLIHDDIIDRDTIRHGALNVTGQYINKYSKSLSDDQEVMHFANGAALLAGDLLLAESHHLIASIDYISKDSSGLTATCFADAIFAVCGGELIDTESSFLDTHIPALAMYEYKTSSYSFVGPLTIGAALAGASDTQLDQLRYIAHPLGVAYQLQDDLLGVFGNTLKTGKSSVGDIREGKRTYMVEQFDLLATKEQKDVFYRVFGVRDCSEEAYSEAGNILKSSGAKVACETKIDELTKYVHKQIDELTISSKHRMSFHAFADNCIKRNK